jgi:arylsulfatase A-like enzyme
VLKIVTLFSFISFLGTRFVDFHSDKVIKRHKNKQTIERSHLLHLNGTHSTTVTRNEAIQAITLHHQNNQKNHLHVPLFLYLPFQAPHTPTQVISKYILQNVHVKGLKRRAFLGMISQVDESIGYIVNTFKKYQMWSNTIMFVFSDNGGQIVQGILQSVY